jgi:aryl-alcohol dehydrogenase-like predicted oxidoreductase
VSRIGLGGCPLGGHGWGADFDRGEAIQAVRAALERGVDFFDTADVYGLGRSEELLAEALGSVRHEVTIASKGGVRWDTSGRTWKDIRPAYIGTAIDASLRRLKLERIPLYYLHWPDGSTAITDAVEGLMKAQRAGKIGDIAVSNFSAGELHEASRVTAIAAVQIQYSLVYPQDAADLFETACSCGVPFVTWGSLAQGLLTGKFDASAHFAADDRRRRYESFQGESFERNLAVVERLKSVSARVRATPGQVALCWLLDSANVASVLVGAKRRSQVEENVEAIRVRLTDEDRRQLADALSPRTAAA